jgi:hypothetical protein
MIYKMHYVNKAGLINSWTEVELPDGAIPLYTQVFKVSINGDSHITIKDRDNPFIDEVSYKYNSETGNLITIDKDGKHLLEYMITTRIYCLIPK